MKKLKVGYLSLVKGSWINDKLESQRLNALEALKVLDVELVDCGLLIQSETEADAVCKMFDEQRVDVILAHFITFSLGTIVPGMAVKLRKPVIFWSEPEPPMTGGRIAANSFCATNMNAHALWKMNLKYSLVYGHADTAVAKIAQQLKVIEAIETLKSVRIGSLGGRVPGFYTSDFNWRCAKNSALRPKILLSLKSSNWRNQCPEKRWTKPFLKLKAIVTYALLTKN